GPTGYGYQWRRCDSSGGACLDLAGALGQSYQLTAADVGATIRVAVTASNGAGSASATSAQTTTVQPPVAAPANRTPPAISGTTTQGQTLTATAGGWAGSPTGYSYQWRRCDTTGASCADINAATASSYQTQAADVGQTIRVTV